MSQTDYDLQRFLQIREEIHEEIRKIDPSVELLKDATRRLISHFEVFENLTADARKDIQEGIEAAFTSAAHTLAQEASKELQFRLAQTIGNLEASVERARVRLESVHQLKRRLHFLTILLAGTLGFIGGLLVMKGMG